MVTTKINSKALWLASIAEASHISLPNGSVFLHKKGNRNISYFVQNVLPTGEVFLVELDESLGLTLELIINYNGLVSQEKAGEYLISKRVHRTNKNTMVTIVGSNFSELDDALGGNDEYPIFLTLNKGILREDTMYVMQGYEEQVVHMTDYSYGYDTGRVFNYGSIRQTCVVLSSMELRCINLLYDHQNRFIQPVNILSLPDIKSQEKKLTEGSIKDTIYRALIKLGEQLNEGRVSYNSINGYNFE